MPEMKKGVIFCRHCGAVIDEDALVEWKCPQCQSTKIAPKNPDEIQESLLSILQDARNLNEAIADCEATLCTLHFRVAKLLIKHTEIKLGVNQQ